MKIQKVKSTKTMDNKIFNHTIKADDTAKDLAFAICDIYANESKPNAVLNAILELCKQIIEK